MFRTRTSRVRPAGAREMSRRRLIRFGGAAAAAVVVWLVTGWPVAALLVGTLVLTTKYFFGGGKIAADRIERLEGLEQWVRHLSDSMASGSMPVQTIVRSADHAPPAIHDQVDQARHPPVHTEVGQKRVAAPVRRRDRRRTRRHRGAGAAASGQHAGI